MHYYSTETLDTQLFQLEREMLIHFPLLTALKHRITHTVICIYFINILLSQWPFFFLLQLHYTMITIYIFYPV